MSKRLVWLRPFLESWPQPDQRCCMRCINKWPRRPGHSSIHEQVCSTHWRTRVFKVGTPLEPQLDLTYSVHHSQATAYFQHSIFGDLVRTCVVVFHKSAPRSSHSSNYSNTSTARRREPTHNKHSKFHTKLFKHNLLWWFDILAP